ncbi:MAG: hypothetical protein COW01_11035 [Bdellovibrionales bacterium CG12_big_fil_rev_8_21_14_0_65_38_15]|nr:MAG: hypothetical protein COW01_11035 [Bdellovibrionales bacterium CG12_big_fil_rev_8_21_14_0_65_38_15]PIR28294.1 MAG: hypothetical protein COV38_16485 [Bdellovibrionales bacterium CG11_big_fil_rev_8_21_14_0_20_38_13]
MVKHKKLSFYKEVLGLNPPSTALMQILKNIFGEEDVPPTRYGLSSLKQLHLKSIKLWRGKFHFERKVIITNLFNHRPTPLHKGWSVKKTQMQDFRGKELTYDSHNGTDFSIPVGTLVVAPAKGKIVKISREFNRGGLKIFIDHGAGLMTTFAHLSRTLVKLGEIVEHGSAIALSGYSGIDGLITFPFGIPHIHFNTWLNGEPVDPFLLPNGKSLWINDFPTPFHQSLLDNSHFQESSYDKANLNKAILACKTASTLNRFAQISNEDILGAEVLSEMNYYPTRFQKRFNIYDKEYNRSNCLTLPFLEEDFDDVIFDDESK